MHSGQPQAGKSLLFAEISQKAEEKFGSKEKLRTFAIPKRKMVGSYNG